MPNYVLTQQANLYQPQSLELWKFWFNHCISSGFYLLSRSDAQKRVLNFCEVKDLPLCWNNDTCCVQISLSHLWKLTPLVTYGRVL